MKTRIKEVRKTLSLNQADFAEKLGLARATIASYETGNSFPSDRTINDICREFNINEQWLRTGNGPMFKEQGSIDNMLATEVAKLLRSEDDFTKKLVYAYLALPQDAKDKVKDFVTELTKDK